MGLPGEGCSPDFCPWARVGTMGRTFGAVTGRRPQPLASHARQVSGQSVYSWAPLLCEMPISWA